jgi:hypothetical protein
MTTSFSDGPAARWSHSPRRPAEAISASAEWIGRPLRSVAVRARKVDEVGRAAGWGKGRKLALTAISLLLGTGVLLSGCAAGPDYEPVRVYEYPYPAYGSLDFDYWGGWGGDWHHHWDHDHDDHGRGEHGH